MSFSGILTFKRSEDLRALAASLPADRLLVETDAPYLAPTPYRGKRNEPAYTAHTLAVLAEARGVGIDEMGAPDDGEFPPPVRQGAGDRGRGGGVSLRATILGCGVVGRCPEDRA